MAEIMANLGQMRAASSELTELVAVYNQELGKLIENKNELDPQWEGESKAKFDASFAKGLESLNDFSRVISEYIRVLNEVIRIIVDAERRGVEIASN